MDNKLPEGINNPTGIISFVPKWEREINWILRPFRRLGLLPPAPLPRLFVVDPEGDLWEVNPNTVKETPELDRSLDEFEERIAIFQKGIIDPPGHE